MATRRTLTASQVDDEYYDTRTDSYEYIYSPYSVGVAQHRDRTNELYRQYLREEEGLRQESEFNYRNAQRRAAELLQQKRINRNYKRNILNKITNLEPIGIGSGMRRIIKLRVRTKCENNKAVRRHLAIRKLNSGSALGKRVRKHKC
jgi:hypothetical protein